MRVLFCNIAWMKYYKGNPNGMDPLIGGGSYVNEYNDAHEKYNFEAIPLTEEVCGLPAGEYCLGFVETKTTNGKTRNQLNIEKISGCEACKKEAQAEDILVIYCARYLDSFVPETYVVGWYKHATVYRRYQLIEFSDDDGNTYPQDYNAIAKKEDCVLLPKSARRKTQWKVPRKKKGVAYGFGQSNVWYATDKEKNVYLQNFLDRIVKQITEYDEENWLEKYPEMAP